MVMHLGDNAESQASEINGQSISDQITVTAGSRAGVTSRAVINVKIEPTSQASSSQVATHGTLVIEGPQPGFLGNLSDALLNS